MFVSISVVAMVTIVTNLPIAAKLSFINETQPARTVRFEYVLLSLYRWLSDVLSIISIFNHSVYGLGWATIAQSV